MTRIPFSFQRLQTHLEGSLLEDEDIDIIKYIDAFNELHSFCTAIGSVFGFVASQIRSKLDIIEEHMRNDEHRGNFVSLKKMISYEKESGLLYRSGYVSCSRTILVLNRGLDFISRFIEEIRSLNGDEGTSSAARRSYYEALVNYHGFFTRQGAYMAMWTLPNRDRLLIQVSSDVEADLTIMPAVVEFARRVYHRTYSCYEREDLTGLP